MTYTVSSGALNSTQTVASFFGLRCICVFVYMYTGRLATIRTASFPAVRRVEIAEWTRVRTVTTCHVYDHLHRELAQKIQDGGGRHIEKSNNCHLGNSAD